MPMGHSAEDQTQKKFIFMVEWRVSEIWEVQVKSLFFWAISMSMWENVLRVLKMCMGGMVLVKEMRKEDCCSYVMKNERA